MSSSPPADYHRHESAAKVRAGFAIYAMKEDLGPLRRALDDPELTREKLLAMNIRPRTFKRHSQPRLYRHRGPLPLSRGHSLRLLHAAPIPRLPDHLPGSFVHRLTTQILKLRHARATSYAKNTHVYNLFSRQIYDLIGKDNLRNRRRQSSKSSTPG